VIGGDKKKKPSHSGNREEEREQQLKIERATWSAAIPVARKSQRICRRKRIATILIRASGQRKQRGTARGKTAKRLNWPYWLRSFLFGGKERTMGKGVTIRVHPKRAEAATVEALKKNRLDAEKGNGNG